MRFGANLLNGLNWLKEHNLTSLLVTLLLTRDLPWPKASPTDVGMNPAPVQALIRDIGDGKYAQIHSLIVIKDGKLVWQEAFNKYTVDTLQDLQSATKTIASFLTGIAMDQKLFDLEDRVLDLLPARYPRGNDPNRLKTTVRDILTMKHGMRWREWGATAKEKDNYIMANSPDWNGYLLKQPMEVAPGTKYSYSTGASVYLSGAIHGKSGMTTEQFAKKYLFDPLGITTQSWWVKDKNGIEHTGGGLKMSAMDLARFGYLFLTDGNWFGKQVVSRKYVKSAFTPDTLNALSVKMGYGMQPISYGYHCWLMPVDYGGKTYPVRAAMGVGGQYIFAIPQLKLLVVTTSWNVAEPAQGAPIGWIRNVFLPSVSR